MIGPTGFNASHMSTASIEYNHSSILHPQHTAQENGLNLSMHVRPLDVLPDHLSAAVGELIRCYMACIVL